jgi:restriction endonuclease S subunit
MTVWPVKTLGEVAVVNPSEPALSEDAPFVPMDAVTAGKRDVQYTQPRGQRSGARARAGDILFARITPCLQNGKVALVQDGIARCGGSSEFIVVRAGSQVLNGYLYQWITSEHIRDEVTALMKGATGRQRLNAEDLALTELPVPPLEEQKRIVALLDAATERVSELTACYEQARTHANNLFTSALRELMEEIDGTVEATLSDLCQVDWGNTNLTKKSYVEGGDYLAVSAAGPDGRIGHAEHKAFTPVLSAIGARCGRMFLPEEDFTAIKNTITLTPKLDVASGKFIYFLFEHLSLPIRGAAQPFIAKGDIEKFEVAIPSLSRQEKIVEQLEMVQAKTSQMVAAYDAKLTAAKNLRQSILEAAFAGGL